MFRIIIQSRVVNQYIAATMLFLDLLHQRAYTLFVSEGEFVVANFDAWIGLVDIGTEAEGSGTGSSVKHQGFGDGIGEGLADGKANATILNRILRSEVLDS